MKRDPFFGPLAEEASRRALGREAELREQATAARLRGDDAAAAEFDRLADEAYTMALVYGGLRREVL